MLTSCVHHLALLSQYNSWEGESLPSCFGISDFAVSAQSDHVSSRNTFLTRLPISLPPHCWSSLFSLPLRVGCLRPRPLHYSTAAL